MATGAAQRFYADKWPARPTTAARSKAEKAPEAVSGLEIVFYNLNNSSMNKATAGRIVVFHPSAQEKEALNNGQDTCPALIVSVHQNNLVNLKVFYDGETIGYKLSVQQQPAGEDQKEEVWSWPVIEKAPAAPAPDLTYGQYLVGVTFNQGGHELVNKFKALAAKALDSNLKEGGPETTDALITELKGAVAAEAATAYREAARCYRFALKNLDWAHIHLSNNNLADTEEAIECAAMWAVKGATKPHFKTEHEVYPATEKDVYPAGAADTSNAEMLKK